VAGFSSLPFLYIYKVFLLMVIHSISMFEFVCLFVCFHYRWLLQISIILVFPLVFLLLVLGELLFVF
jgi:hypothetical protein